VGRRWRFVRVAIQACVVAAVVGCGTRRELNKAPEPALAGSPEAQLAFTQLQREWSDEDDRERFLALLQEFVATHPRDDRARIARAYLAWLYVENGQLELASATASVVRTGPPGSARDFADVVHGAIMTRRRRPELAVRVLEPLAAKLIDARERFIFGQELASAALASRHYQGAAAALLDWLAHAGVQYRERVQRATEDLLRGLDAAALERTLGALAQHEARSPTGIPALQWLRTAVRERLARLAVNSADASLARRLLETGPPSFPATEQGRALSQIATRGSVSARIVGRAVGLVLSLKTDETRRRSAEVTAGVTKALDLPAAAAVPGSVRLFLEEDDGKPGDLSRALTALAGEGASILIAGVDDPGAAEAREHAERTRTAVMVLHGNAAPAARYAITLAAPAHADRTVLEAELDRRGLTRRAYVGTPELPCDVAAPSAGQLRFPVQLWRKEDVRAILLLGDAACARQVLTELRSVRYRPTLAFGFESAPALSAREGAPGVHVAAGRFPRGKASASDVSWYEALGHDAASLAREALREFSLNRVEERREVERLHERARANLLRATAPLWSSEQRGLAGAPTLRRALTAKVTSGEAGSP
jgi:hypothetical protein